MPLSILLACLIAAPSADLVVTNARIWTDGRLTRHDTLAVRNGRIVHLGKLVPGLIGPRTRRVDALGRMVIPGLIDSHTHVVESGAAMLYDLPLRGAVSKADFLAKIKAYSEKLPPGRWVVGNGWSAESWPEKETPTREWLDSVTGGRPAILHRMDGHSAIANTEALRRAKITRDTKDPAGGVIDRDKNGEPTGMLRETAVGLVQVPGPTAAERYEGLQAAAREANRYGVTAVSDVTATAYFPILRKYATSNRPTLRVAAYARTPERGPWNVVIARVKGERAVPGWFVPRGLKAYMDGSLGSRTAYMAAPFDAPLAGQAKGWRGVPMPGAVDGTYARGLAAAAAADLQVMIHAIGDQANHDLLNMYAQTPGIKRRRFRVEHVQHLLPGDIPRFASLGVIPSLQPYHKADDGRYCEAVIGRKRSESSYAFRDLVRNGARMAFGSDFDVVTINPWEGIEAAVNGRILTGKVWMPHQNISLDQALTAYTQNAAYAMFMENEIGRIAPGYRADFVILDRWPYQKGLNLAKVRTTTVFVDGREASTAASR